MAKEYQFNWHIHVADALIEGANFDRWDEVKPISTCIHVTVGTMIAFVALYIMFFCGTSEIIH